MWLLAAGVSTAGPLPLELQRLGNAVQSATMGVHDAWLALDGDPQSFARTTDAPGAFWEFTLERPVRARAVVILAPDDPALEGVLDGAVLELSNLEGQVVATHGIDGVAPGDAWHSPELDDAWVRRARISLPDGMVNGAGRHDIALASFDLFGDPSPMSGPVTLRHAAVVSQSSTAGGFAAGNAIDGNTATFSETDDEDGAFWMLELVRPRHLDRIEIVNRPDGLAARLGGVTFALLDENGGIFHESVIGNPGPGKTWIHDVPEDAGVVGGIRLSLGADETNDHGDRVISIADVSLIIGRNVALDTEAYMVRLHDGLPEPGLANDGDRSTFTESSNRTVDAYWETDLGQEYPLDSVRVLALDSGLNRQRLSRATLRLFDADHQSIHSEHLSGHVTGVSAGFDIPLPGVVNARYVRVGLEDKERTGAIEWYLRIAEVQAFARHDSEHGILEFHASENNIPNGEPVLLEWRQAGMHKLKIHPGTGSVGALTASDGSGSVQVWPAESTEYTMVAEAPFHREVRHASVLVDGEALPLLITEFCASNTNSFEDGFGNSPDWIEIGNPNPFPWDLSGHGLSDNPANPMKWTFPAGTELPANGTMLVMASGRDTGPDPDGWLHASFSLSAGGESVVLTAPDGMTTLDAIIGYPPQKTDLAYGRMPVGGFGFLEPSPGVRDPEATAYHGWLDAPVFSETRGYRDEALTLALDNPNPVGIVYFSLDGSEPATLYEAPLEIAASTVVRAMVREPGWLASDITTHSFLFVDSVMASPSMRTTYTNGPLAGRLRDSFSQLPTISLTVPEIPDDRIEREASVEILMADGSEPLQVNAGLNRMGGAWTDYAKRSYRLKFRSRYGASRLESPLLDGFDRGIPVRRSIKTLQLHGGNQDMQGAGFYMSGRFVDDTMLEMGRLNPHGRYVHLFINGEYWGQYDAHERLEDAFLATYLGGSRRDYVNVLGNDNIGFTFVPGTPEPPNRESWELARASRHSYEALRELVDVPHLIDFMLLWLYGNAESEFRAAGSVVPGESGFKFWMNDADGFLRTSAVNKNSTNNQGPGFLFGALASEGHPDFMMLLADHIHRHCHHGGALTPSRCLERLDRRMEEVWDSIIAECARWGYRTPTNWLAYAENIKENLFPQRTIRMMNNLRNRGLYPSVEAPVFAPVAAGLQPDTSLVLNARGGSVHYTLDGTDPRLPGGGVSPSAQSITLPAKNLIPTGAVWQFDDGIAPVPADWMEPGYDDSAWASGVAPLGYGGGQATLVPFGADPENKPMSVRFRTSFVVGDPSEFAAVACDIACDDGAVVFLNGQEILRFNMPDGPVDSTTPALVDVIGNAKLRLHPHLLPTTHLVAGENVVAVEVHQFNASSPDLFFNFSLGVASQIEVPSDAHVRARVLDGNNWSAVTNVTLRNTHPLALEPYVFSRWDASAQAGTYPPAMRIMQAENGDPRIDAVMDQLWVLGYDFSSRSRIIGLGEAGLGFVNTGNAQAIDGAGYVGAAVVSLDTRGVSDIHVTWTGGTVVPNQREQAIRLQYRVVEDGPFVDVTDGGGMIVEYARNAVAGHTSRIGPVILPSDAEEREHLELRWIYHHVSGDTGPRAQLRLDDIVITHGGRARDYEHWRLREFADVMPDDVHRISDPASSYGGLLNLLRYGFGIGRDDPPAGYMPELTGNGTLRFFMDPDKSDLVYRVRSSADMVDWSHVEFDSSLQPLPAKTEGLYNLPLEIDGWYRMFYRIEISR